MPDVTLTTNAQTGQSGSEPSRTSSFIGDGARVAGGSFAKVRRVAYGAPKRKTVALSGLGIEIHYGETDNPCYTKASKEDADNPKRISVAWNARESPLVRMALRGALDERQALAGHMFRSLWEQMQGGLRSSSHIQERVDGGSPPDVFTESRANAARQLKAAELMLGAKLYFVLRAVCGEGRTLSEVATLAKCRKANVLLAFREALDQLAEYWDLGKRRRDG